MPFIFPTIHIYNYRTYVKYNLNTYKVKLLVSDYDSCAFNELGAISKSSFSLNKFCVSEMLHFIVVHMTILKHKNSPFFCTCCYDKMLNKLKFCQWVMYHVFHRVISLSGDVEENPGLPDYRNANTKVVARSGQLHLNCLQKKLVHYTSRITLYSPQKTLSASYSKRNASHMDMISFPTPIPFRPSPPTLAQTH